MAFYLVANLAGEPRRYGKPARKPQGWLDTAGERKGSVPADELCETARLTRDADGKRTLRWNAGWAQPLAGQAGR